MAERLGLSLHGIEVLQGGRLVRLIPSPPDISSANAQWDGLALEIHHAPPCDHPAHEHPTHFLQLQTAGPVKYEWTARGQDHSGTAGPGTIFICPRGSRDRVLWQGPTSRIALAVHPRLLAQALEQTAHLQDIELRQHFELHDRHLESLMRALRADLEDGSPAGRLYGESLATALAVYLQRRYAVFPTPILQFRNGMPTARLNRVLEFIRANLSEDIKLSALAETAGMSSHYFSELFKQSTGLSPHQYVLREKVERAKEHLRNPNTSIIEASAITGFVDQSYFTKVFRRLVGVTPSEFRANAVEGRARAA